MYIRSLYLLIFLLSGVYKKKAALLSLAKSYFFSYVNHF